MAEEKDKGNDKQEAEASSAPAKKSRKTLFVVLGLVLVVILIGVPLAIFLNKEEKPESKSAEKVEVDISKEKEQSHKLAREAEEEVEEGEEILGAIAPLDTFVVNLKGGKFIRLQLQLEFTERDVPARMLQRAAIVRDAIITLVTIKSAEDVLDREGKERLRKEIRQLVNEALRKELVKQVYFTQFVVQ